MDQSKCRVWLDRTAENLGFLFRLQMCVCMYIYIRDWLIPHTNLLMFGCYIVWGLKVTKLCICFVYLVLLKLCSVITFRTICDMIQFFLGTTTWSSFIVIITSPTMNKKLFWSFLTCFYYWIKKSHHVWFNDKFYWFNTKN